MKWQFLQKFGLSGPGSTLICTSVSRREREKMMHILKTIFALSPDSYLMISKHWIYVKVPQLILQFSFGPALLLPRGSSLLKNLKRQTSLSSFFLYYSINIDMDRNWKRKRWFALPLSHIHAFLWNVIKQLT